jgi:hypothetical protein
MLAFAYAVLSTAGAGLESAAWRGAAIGIHQEQVMPTIVESTQKRLGRRIALSGIALAALVLGTAGCDQHDADEPRGGGYVEETTENQDQSGLPQPEARSALGKAKQRAEKLVNEDVAEYNKKLEEAIDGKTP